MSMFDPEVYNQRVMEQEKQFNERMTFEQVEEDDIAGGKSSSFSKNHDTAQTTTLGK